MFTDKDNNSAQVDLDSTRFLGRISVAEGFLGVLQRMTASIFLNDDRARVR